MGQHMNQSSAGDDDDPVSDRDAYRQGILGLQRAVQRSFDCENVNEPDEEEVGGKEMNENEDEDEVQEDQEDRAEDEESAQVDDEVEDNNVKLPNKRNVSGKEVTFDSAPKEHRKRRRGSDDENETAGSEYRRSLRNLKKGVPSTVATSHSKHPTKRIKVATGRPQVVTVVPKFTVAPKDTEDEDEQIAQIRNNQLKLAPMPPILESQKTYDVYGPNKKDLVSFAPIAHHAINIQVQEEFLQGVLDLYIDGKPLHLANPMASAFCILSSTEFEKKTVHEVHEIFSRQNIIVYDLPCQGLPEFNESAFYAMVPSIDQDVDVQDQSIQPKRMDENYNCRLKQGTPRQILHAHRNNGKVLNALNFPGTRLTQPDLSLSSDLVAWEATQYQKMSKGKEYPVRNMRWFIAATKGASHMWHLDSNGTGTFICPDNGAKCWIVASRKDGHPEESFSSVDFFLPPGFEITKVCDDKWKLEAVVLKPGSCLFMRPNTPHSVFTIDSATCKGGHFYSISTMQASAASMMHTFITGSVTTNTNHDPTRPILRRMAELCYRVFVRNKFHDNPRVLNHVPDLNNLDGVLNLLSLCNLVIFANILDGQTYLGWQQVSSTRTKKQNHDLQVYDRNALSSEDREKYLCARGMCLQVLFWFAASFEVTTEGSAGEPIVMDNVLEQLAFAYLIQQGRALLEYKKKAIKCSTAGFPGCTLQKLTAQLDAVFSLNDELNQCWISSKNDPDKSKYSNLLWSGRRDLRFTKKHNVHLSGKFKGSSYFIFQEIMVADDLLVVDFHQAGTTTLDQCFFDGYLSGFPDKY